MTTRRISLVVFPSFQPLDLTGPHEIFHMANEVVAGAGGERAGPAGPRPRPYRLEVLSAEAGLVRAGSGLAIAADRTLDSVHGRVDTLLVAGGDGRGVRDAVLGGSYTAFLARMAPRVRRIGSVCSGAFLLAAAGLLDGRRATTHWASASRLAAMFPKVEVDADAIWVRDGSVYTSAGVTAGIDLALALVEEDLGREVALAVARRAVVFLKRPGGQSQFSAELAAQVRATGPLERLPEWIRENLDSDLGVEALAGRVGMSPRNFARVFRRQFDTTPARFVERARVERARRYLEDTRSSLDEIADACGFGSSERMRRSFSRVLNVGPGAYRDRFEKPPLRPLRRVG